MLCPECNAIIEFESLESIHDGEIITCGGCDTPLEVVFLDGGGYALDVAQDAITGDLGGLDEEDGP